MLKGAHERRVSRSIQPVSFVRAVDDFGEKQKMPSNTIQPQRRTSRAPLGFGRRDLIALQKLQERIETPEQVDDEKLLRKLQKIFDAKEEEEETGLTIDEFEAAMRNTVGRHSTKDEIELLFMKVDANCDGAVDWEEYVTYNLLEYKEKTRMLEMLREKPFPNEIQDIDSRHRDTIVKILFYPAVRKSGSKSGSVDLKVGKYMTLSKEGTLGLWTLGMRNLKYYNANHYTNRNTQPWFTDMVAMYNVNMLAITSTDRDITIFDLSGKKFTMRYYLTGFESCITAMDYWVDFEDMNNALLLLGDQSGSVFCLMFDSSLRGGPFGTVNGKKNTCKRIIFPEVLRGFSFGVKAQKKSNIHNDWVNKVQYLPDINCFLSSCQCPQTALFFGDFNGKKSHVYFKVNKGILSFDYSQTLNIIVTGGMDYLLRVWNPYVNNKAIVLLKGHTKPVNHVIIYDSKNQVISIDKGRSLRVYDLRDQTCLQQISGRMIKFDPLPISAVYFNPVIPTTLLAANQIVMLEKRDDEEKCADIMSHNKPVVAALYSHVFGSTVSACQESVVSVWDTDTGDKLMQFVNAHSCVQRGVEVPVEITALCFDYNGRRLVTGARNGTVHVWNFNNGLRMQDFELPDGSAVTGVACTAHSIYTSGWGKIVHIYIDGASEDHRKSWKMRHKEDILCIAHFPPNLIATGGYDGDVVIWSRDTGQVYCRLNAFNSVKPVTECAPRHHGNLVNSSAKSQPKSTSSDESQMDVTHSKQWKKRKAKITRTFGMLASLQGHQRDEDEVCEHPLLDALDSKVFSTKEKTVHTRTEYDTLCKHYESAVEKILFLESREPLHKDTAIIVTSGAEGWIRFWSMHHEGGLLGQFNAAHQFGESVLAIKCDAAETFLVTGDTQGYVKVWDIMDFCISKNINMKEKRERIDYLRKSFTFYRVENYEGEKQFYTVPDHLKNVFANRPPPASSEPGRTLRYPPLVNSFRAHTSCIHSVEYVSHRQILITASRDCSVRMWTINGQYIGTFGGQAWKSLPKVVDNEYFLAQIPNDIKRTGSARTLKVMHGGKTPRWQSAISILRERGFKRLKKQFDHLQPTAEARDESDHGDGDFVTSDILGKSYKRTTRHRMAPKLPKFIETPGSVAVYHALSFVELTPVEKNNRIMKEIHDRRAGNIALNRLRGVQNRKQDQPGFMSLFTKMVTKPKTSPRKPPPANRMKKVAERFQGPIQTESAQQQQAQKQQQLSVLQKRAISTKKIKNLEKHADDTSQNEDQSRQSRAEIADETMEEFDFPLERHVCFLSD
ncbi:WD repeat-containing protein on Y chromosome-like [Mya arenaria]|uniref:WD repeat-containing protein on Y chromosome-like n=1 Tax=Mya arenaria TaxID=6604 RepID=UPI0022E0B19B|nr:WD repeat-containing protein on Y chromosome-like [Mya arenaria]